MSEVGKEKGRARDGDEEERGERVRERKEDGMGGLGVLGAIGGSFSIPAHPMGKESPVMSGRKRKPPLVWALAVMLDLPSLLPLSLPTGTVRGESRRHWHWRLVLCCSAPALLCCSAAAAPALSSSALSQTHQS